MKKGKQEQPCMTPEARAAGTRIKPSTASRKRAAVLIGVHVLFALHLAHLASSGSTLAPLEPSEAMELSKKSVLNAGAVFFGLMILSTAIFGRWFCGWSCHLVALQDLCRAMLLKVGIRPKPLRSRALALVPMAAFLYMFIWPLVPRIEAEENLAAVSIEMETSDFWATFPGLTIALLTFAVCGFVVIYFLGAKGFCTYACPYGAIFGVVDRVAPGRIRVTDACEGCGHCTATCSSNVKVAQEVREFGMVVDAGCMKCMDCVSVCPKGALYFGFGKVGAFAAPRVEPKARRPRSAALSLGEELLLSAAFIAAFLSFRGLYGQIPFLLSLSIAGIVAYVALMLTRLLRGQAVALPGWKIWGGKGSGAISRPFLLFSVVMLAWWVSAAVVQVSTWQASNGLVALTEARSNWFEAGAPSARAEFVPAFLDVERAARRAQAWSPIPVDDPRLYPALAWGKLASDDARGFLQYAALAEEGGSSSPRLVLEVALLLRSLENFAAAEPVFARVTELHPDIPAGWAGQAECMTRRGAIDEARAVLEEGLSQGARGASMLHDLAVLETVAGNAERAIELLTEALDLDADFAEARAKLVMILDASGRPEEARRVRDEAP